MRITKILSLFFPESAESFLKSFKFEKHSVFDYLQWDHLNIETIDDSKKQAIIDFKTSPYKLTTYSDLKYTQKPNLNNSHLKKALSNIIANFHFNLIEVGVEQVKLESIKKVESN